LFKRIKLIKPIKPIRHIYTLCEKGEK